MISSKKNLDVYNVGTNVSLTESVSAKIITVAIHADNAVQYECAWWNGDMRTREWFTSDDFINIGKKDTPMKIGFLRA